MFKGFSQKLNNNKNLLLLALIIIFLCLAAMPITHALFEKGTEFDVAFSFGTANMEMSHIISADTLRNPGDKKTMTISLENDGEVPLKYLLSIERSAADDRLASNLLVYWDEKFLGTLADITTGQLGTLDEGGAIAGVFSADEVLEDSRYFLTVGDSHVHTLTLEYHIGAKAIDMASGRSASFTLRAYAENIDLSEETIVSDAYELEQAMLLSNFGILPQKRIILGDDIMLTKNLSLTAVNASSGAINIDLNGKTLNLGSNSINVSGEGVLILSDSRGTNRLQGGSFVLAGENAYIAGDALDGYTGSFDVSAFSPSVATSESLFGKHIIPKAQKNVKKGIKSGENSPFIGGYSKYGAKLLMNVPAYISYNSANGTLSTSSVINKNANVRIGGYDVPFEIIGSAGVSQIDIIEQNYLSMLTEANPVIYYDLLLPTRFKEYDCYVTWWSSNPEILDETGNYTSPWTDQNVTLLATYTINDTVVSRTYDVTVKGYSYEEKMSYFMAHFGSITYNLIPQDRYLWAKESYLDPERCNKDLDINSISYSIPAEFQGFLKFADASNMVLRLYNSSTEFECNVDVTITFKTPPPLGGIPSTANTITKSIPIFIKLDDYTTTEDLLRYVQSYIAKQLGSAPFSSPVSFYDLLTKDRVDYPDYIELPSYFEATNTVIDESGNPYTFTIAFHDIRYMIANTVAGNRPADGDGNYDVAKTGTLEIEYTNVQPAIDAVNLVPYEGVIVGTTEMKPGITSYRLYIDEDNMIGEDLTLNLIASLGTDFDGKYNSLGDFIEATPQDRRCIQFEIPAALDATDFDDPVLHNGDSIYNIINAAEHTYNMLTAGRSYTFIRDLGVVEELAFDVPLTDSNLAPLRHFKSLTSLDISAKEDAHGNIENNDVTDATVQILGTLTGLTLLDMSYCDVTDIEPLAACKDMEELSLKGNYRLQDATPVTNMAGNLYYLDTRDTDCDPFCNEWAYAYSYYMYRDRHDGTKPLYYTGYDGLGNASEEAYDVPYTLWQNPEAFNTYRRLVYANAKFKEIGEVSKSAGYVWLPKAMIDSIAPNPEASPVAAYYTTSTWGSESANITVNNGSGNYAGNQIVLSGASAGQVGIVSHSLTDMANIVTIENVEREFINEDNTTYSAIVPEERVTPTQIESKRYFFINIK